MFLVLILPYFIMRLILVIQPVCGAKLLHLGRLGVSKSTLKVVDTRCASKFLACCDR